MKIDSEAVLKALATAMNDDAFSIILEALQRDRNDRNIIYQMRGIPFEDGKLYGATHKLDGIIKDLLDIRKAIHTLEEKKQ